MKQLLIVIGFLLIIQSGYCQSEFDHIDGKTIYFKDSTSVTTNLCGLKFIGEILPANSFRYLIISGRACTSPGAKIFVFIEKPVEDKIIISPESSFYSYPYSHYNKDGSLFSESRAFYGEILPDRYGIIWFHKIYLSQNNWKYSVFLAEIIREKIVESSTNELLSKTLEQVNTGKAYEFKELTEFNN
jgi:hypothetical protein